MLVAVAEPIEPPPPPNPAALLVDAVINFVSSVFNMIASASDFIAKYSSILIDQLILLLLILLILERGLGKGIRLFRDLLNKLLSL